MTNDNTKGKSLEGNALFPDRPDSLILILLPFLLFRYHHYYFPPFLPLQRQHPVMASLCTSIMTVICHSQLWNSSAGVNLTTPAIFEFSFLLDRYQNRTWVIPEGNSTGKPLSSFNGGKKHVMAHPLL